MDIRNVLLKIKGGSYKARYLILMWIKSFGLKQVTFNDIKGESCFALSLSEKSLRSIIAELVEMKMIEPKASLNISSEIVKGYILHEDFNPFTTGSGKEVSSRLDSLASRVLFHVSENSPKASPNAKFKDSHFRLAIDSRLLLAVLLLRATKCGVVMGTGTAELASTSGMGKSKVKNQIEVLTKLGFIHHTVPGVTGACFFGVRPSVYYMNLNHVSFDDAGVNRDVYLLKNTSDLALEAKPLFNVAHIKKFTAYGLAEKEFGLIDSCNKVFGEMNRHTETHFQAFINNIASHMLSNYWDGVVKLSATHKPEASSFNGITEVICRGLFPPSANALNQSEKRQEHAHILIQYVFLFSYRLARAIQSQLVKVAGNKAYNSYVVNKLAVGSGAKVIFYVECFGGQKICDDSCFFDVRSGKREVVNFNDWDGLHNTLNEM